MSGQRREHVQFALGGTYLGDVGVKVAYRILPELLQLVAFGLRQMRYVMALQQAMQERAARMRNSRLRRREAIDKLRRETDSISVTARGNWFHAAYACTKTATLCG